MPTLLQHERAIQKLRKEMSQVRQLIGLYPPLVDPLKWDLLAVDKRVLTFLIEQPRGARSTSTEIAAALGLENPSKSGRVLVWRALKRILRMSRRKRKNILEVDRTRKTYAIDRTDFMFPGDLLR